MIHPPCIHIHHSVANSISRRPSTKIVASTNCVFLAISIGFNFNLGGRRSRRSYRTFTGCCRIRRRNPRLLTRTRSRPPDAHQQQQYVRPSWTGTQFYVHSSISRVCMFTSLSSAHARPSLIHGARGITRPTEHEKLQNLPSPVQSPAYNVPAYKPQRKEPPVWLFW